MTRAQLLTLAIAATIAIPAVLLDGARWPALAGTLLLLNAGYGLWWLLTRKQTTA
jgi:hypothetical protein